MDNTPLTYNKLVVGNDFLSRKKEVGFLTDLLRQRRNALIYDSPKMGKSSLVHQAFLNLQSLSDNFTICSINLFNIRSSDVFLRTLVHSVAPSVSNTLSDWNSFSEKYLSNIDVESGAPLTHGQMMEMIAIPEKISQDSNSDIIVYIEEFQEILLFDNSDSFLSLLEKEWSTHKHATYLITGSRVNAMKSIFEEKKMFYNFAERIKLLPLEEKDVTDHITRTFLKVGRVVGQSQASYIYQSVMGHPWYILQIASTCYHLTKGYLSDKIMLEAIDSLLSTQEMRFSIIMRDLSNFQITFLRAINEGVTRFSALEIIEKYKLNSSANVFRIKEALKKKEIITFNDNDEPVIMDPLFKMWLKKYYFA